MKKKLSYRDKLIELAYIYNVKEIQDYVKRRKNLTTGQIELILKKMISNVLYNLKCPTCPWKYKYHLSALRNLIKDKVYNYGSR